MKVIIVGKNRNIEPIVRRNGFKIVCENPDFVISYGGDGSFMHAEHLYPGIPKILLKDSLICKKCSSFSNEEVLKCIYDKKYKLEDLMKLEVYAKNQIMFSVNDVILHNDDPRHAIRYSLSINNKQIGGVIIGDGIVAATPFGSTAYYRSITDSFFEVGIGLAFNNSIEQSDHAVLKEDSIIKIKIIRGPAVIFTDNHEQKIILEKDEEAVIKKSILKAQIAIPFL